MISRDVIAEIAQAQIPFVENEPGTKLTTAATGGAVGLLLIPDTIEQLSKIFEVLHQYQLTPKVIGNGSNVLIPDSGMAQPLIKLGRGFKFYELNGTTLTAGASTYLPALSREISKRGLSGLEFAGGIPASVGGAVRMNAGAHGGEMSSVITEIHCIDFEGKAVNFARDKIEWGYRHNSLPQELIVTSVIMELVPKDPSEIEALHRQFLEERKRHQPLQYPSFGSVFKNPEGQRGSAGKLIESVGLKGFQIGNAMIAAMHANWIVNPNKNAKTSDMTALIDEAQKRVQKQYNILLQPEVIRW